MPVAFAMYVAEKAEAETDPVLAPYSILEEDDGHYICGIVLFTAYRGHGPGARFSGLADDRARERKLATLSLIVFEQNVGAKRLYGRHG